MPDDWTDTFEAHRERLFNLAYRMLGRVQAAEDAVQDAYAVLNSDKLRHVDPPGNSTRRAYDSLSEL